MARDNLYYDLVHAAAVEECEAHRQLLYDAAVEINRLRYENEELRKGRNRITMSVTLSEQRIREMLEEAFINITGKDLEYVAQAIREKMIREGELDGEEEAEQEAPE